MLPQTYIFIVKGTLLVVGILLIGLGFYLLSDKVKNDFEFSISILDKLSTKLKGANAGLFFILLGVVLMISVILIPMEAKWQVEEEKKEVLVVNDFPIRNEREVFDKSE
jgi:uncharacterized membrane protein